MSGRIFLECGPSGSENHGLEEHLESDLGFSLYSATISSVIVVIEVI